MDNEKVSWHKFVWHKHSSLRFSIYSWIAFKEGLKTASNLATRGISVCPSCIFCKSNLETHNHLFFECDFSFNILLRFFSRMQSMLLRSNLWQVFNYIEDQEVTNNMKNYHFLSISAIVYFIWRSRNDRLFSNCSDSVTVITSKIKRAVYLKIHRKNASKICSLDLCLCCGRYTGTPWPASSCNQGLAGCFEGL
ncbi:hypothetical protein MA16_Dca028108 [Dendrobium catenatum]|uniref:Reverse transcriptase zinc-binding domain-containing protein n=1 Tax=Dendrobium catenatum TaxID=906689 RepID=A0A2I0VB14_9ASPA|nr:hypothetical protein MA16_Dca028108 [Dendrobium catenatum]